MRGTTNLVAYLERQHHTECSGYRKASGKMTGVLVRGAVRGLIRKIPKGGKSMLEDSLGGGGGGGGVHIVNSIQF